MCENVEVEPTVGGLLVQWGRLVLVGVVVLTAGVGPDVWENVEGEPTAGAFVV